MVEIKKVKDKIVEEGSEKISAIQSKFSFLVNGLPDNLRKRIISALILIPIVLFFLYFSKLFFSIFVLFAVVLMTFEWTEITKSEPEKQNQWRVLGLAYSLSPTVSLLIIRNVDKGADIILWLLAVIWATDIGAYFVGKNIGGPKLAPTISPNKTISGLIGGIVCSMLIGFLSSFMFQEGPLFFSIFSGFLAIVEQISDLLESKLKRHFGLKDSGNIIPGHGGILDRIDGITLTAPLVMLLLITSTKIF
mgnify:CR=1 FL=1